MSKYKEEFSKLYDQDSSLDYTEYLEEQLLNRDRKITALEHQMHYMRDVIDNRKKEKKDE